MFTTLLKNRRKSHHSHARRLALAITETLEPRVVLSSGTGLQAQYYENTDFTALTGVRTDPAVNFSWGLTTPAGTGLSSDGTYAVRWSGQVEPLYNETYTFSLASAGAARLWVNGQLLVDNLSPHPLATNTATLSLTSRKKVDLELDFVGAPSLTGIASQVTLSWSSPSQTAQPIPSSLLYPASRGSVTRELWTNLPGTQLTDLTSLPTYQSGQPDTASTVTSLAAPTNAADNFGARIQGYVTAPTTGVYTFYLASQNAASFSLADDQSPTNAKLVASTPGQSLPNDYLASPSQQYSVRLTQGQAYYFSALQKAAFGADSLSVAWAMPGSSAISVIPGDVLSPVLPVVSLSSSTTTLVNSGASSARITVTRTGPLASPLTVSYFATGTAISGTDYAPLPGTLTIPAGSASADILITPRSSSFGSGSKSLTLELSAAQTYSLDVQSAITSTVLLYDSSYASSVPTLLPANPDSSYLAGSNTYGSQRTIAITGMPFSSAQRFTTATKPPNPFNYLPYINLTNAINTNDVLLLSFWARSGTSSTAFAQPLFQLANNFDNKPLFTTIQVTSQWQQYFFPFQVSYSSVGTLGQVGFNLGFDPQTFDVASIQLRNFGPSVSVSSLPSLLGNYDGRDLNSTWRSSASTDITANRTGRLSVTVLDSAGAVVPGAQVWLDQKENSFGFGSAVTSTRLTSADTDSVRYQNTVKQLFNKAVLENDLKWPGWQGSPARAISGVQWLTGQGISVRGHNLVWPSWKYIPASNNANSGVYNSVTWSGTASVPASQAEYNAHVTADGLPAANAWLAQRILSHIQDEAGATGIKGNIAEWDVLNEAYINNQVTNLVGGNSAIASWFQAAASADPSAMLYYNNYGNIDNFNLTNSASINYDIALIQYLQSQGVRIDGYGLQSHMLTALTGISAVKSVYNQLAALGIKLEVTEFDTTLTDLQQQADYTRDIMTLAYSNPSMTGFLQWGFWAGQMFYPQGALYNLDWSIKPNGQVFSDLVLNKWMTDTTGTTGADGIYAATGYTGTYSVNVRVGTLTKTVSATLSTTGTNLTITLDQPVNYTPAVTLPATASSPNVAGKTVNLTVAGTDLHGTSNLDYTWSARGPAGVSFASAASALINGTNAAQNIVATFSAPGTYTLTATIANDAGLSVTSSTTVTVLQTLTGVTLTPIFPPQIQGPITLASGNTLQYQATPLDQFNGSMTAQLTFAADAPNTISQTGLFTAGDTPGPYNLSVTATSDTLSFTAFSSVYVTPPAPPLAPASLTATKVRPGAIQLNWVPASLPVTAYVIDLALDANFTTGRRRFSLTGSALSLLLSGLTPGQNYFFRLRALGILGYSTFSPTASAKA